MKRKSCFLVLFLIFLYAIAYAGDDWVRKYPANSPDARNEALAYVGGKKVLLFGGKANGLQNDTWIYDLPGNTWTDLTPTSTPSVRTGHCLAYIGDDKVLLFGGSGTSGLLQDTWIFDLSDNQWTQMNPPIKPSAREHHAMAYIGDGKVLLFGGEDESSYLGDTWIYDFASNTWINKSPTSAPAARISHDIVYLGGDLVLLFGGRTASSLQNNDTWIYDLSQNQWIQKHPSTSPQARRIFSMAYMGDNMALLFGGNSYGAYLADTWIYDLSTNSWYQDSNNINPSGRWTSHSMAMTSLTGSSYIVLFGGSNDDGQLNDTWTFGGGDYSLPVQVSSFYAEAKRNKIVLYWQTESEVNIKGYNIWRKNILVDNNFVKINNVSISSKGNSSSRFLYKYEDNAVSAHAIYLYKLEIITIHDSSNFYGPIKIKMKDDNEFLPKTCRICGNYPNPFNAGTTIEYELPKDGMIRISVCNTNGQTISTLFNGWAASGRHKIYWDGRSNYHVNLPSGIYFVMLRAFEREYYHKVVVIR